MKNLRLIFTISLVLILKNTWAQLCTEDDRYTNASYFTNTQIDSLKNTTYGTAVNYLGEDQDLKMDLYFPNNKIDKIEKRPLILLIHGGAFFGGQKEDFTYLCKEFAKRGFVAATMNYRLGFDQKVKGEMAKAIYRAQQDANIALSYVAKHAESLRIDPQWVFLGGSSAGAITALYTGFASQTEWNSILPQFEPLLGPLKDNLAQNTSIKGIYNMMGAVFPVVFTSGDLIPTISFHGDIDQTVPIEKSQIAGFGSKPIHEILTKAGVCNDLTIVEGVGHRIYMSKKGKDFMINRVSHFFKSLFCDTCTTDVFTDKVDTN